MNGRPPRTLSSNGSEKIDRRPLQTTMQCLECPAVDGWMGGCLLHGDYKNQLLPLLSLHFQLVVI